MCGIIGAFWKNEPPSIEDRLSSCLDLLKHRGPDDRGQWFHRDSLGTVALGHTRLSIIDLSDAGHQPMHSSDGRWTLVYNGEIYNYLELRGELEKLGQQFVSDSDTEVLLAPWAHWGPACLERLVGMFAFAVYDQKEKTITLVRDAFGIKPLFFSHNCDRFFFGSEISALFPLIGKPLEANPQRVYDYLIHSVQDTGSDTFVQGISHVPPAHLVRLDLTKPDVFETERWWNPNIAQTSRLSFADAADNLRELFLESVRLHLRSDVPVGVALSGGIDSSAITCAIRHLEPDMPIHTFSYISTDPVSSEERWIDIVNEYVDAQVHRVCVEPEDLTNDLSDLIKAQGEPFCTTSMYAQYRVFQEARKYGITVVLEGQGADELLAGYHGYVGQRMRSLLETGDIGGMFRFSANWKRWPGRQGQTAWRALAGQLLPDGLYQVGLRIANLNKLPQWLDAKALRREGISMRPYRLERLHKGRGRRVAEVLSLALTKGGLPSLLRYGDRNAMRFSIENRVPFLTLSMANFILGLPEQYLVSEHGETKSIFRKAMRGIVPDAILDRRDKIGFETPMQSWLLPLGEEIRKNLEEASKFSYLSTDRMISDFEGVVVDKRRLDAQTWRMINLCWWANLNALR